MIIDINSNWLVGLWSAEFSKLENSGTPNNQQYVKSLKILALKQVPKILSSQKIKLPKISPKFLKKEAFTTI